MTAMPAPAPMDPNITDDGVALVRRLVDAGQIERLKAAIEACRQTPGPSFRTLSPPGQPVLQSDLFRWRDNAEFRALATEGAVPRLAAEIFGTQDVVLMEDQFFYSAEGASTPSPWHQDHPYHPLEPWFLTIWIPLDAPPAGTGLRAAAGSHRGEIYAPVEFSAGKKTLQSDAAVLRKVPDIDADPASFGVFAPDVDPGDAMVLDSRTLHAAGGLCTGVFRRLSLRYAHPDTRYRLRPWPVATFWAEHHPEAHEGERIAGPAFPLITA
ncbi:MAG: phytanoyl-CoA dioxygenase family protein [Bauldia sp.]|nr:phytanoyl-CoA dioxygenase family protein [Bauldia sp.]